LASGCTRSFLTWPYRYPWPQRPAGLVETAFGELASRWRPILDYADEMGVDLCEEVHPGEDLHNDVTVHSGVEMLKEYGGPLRQRSLAKRSQLARNQMERSKAETWKLQRLFQKWK
jgi:hypothetical protein